MRIKKENLEGECRKRMQKETLEGESRRRIQTRSSSSSGPEVVSEANATQPPKLLKEQHSRRVSIPISTPCWFTWCFVGPGSLPHPQGRCQEPRAPRRADGGSRSLAPNFTRVLLATAARPDSPPVSRRDLPRRPNHRETVYAARCSRTGATVEAVSGEPSFARPFQPGCRQLRSLTHFRQRKPVMQKKYVTGSILVWPTN